MKKIGKENLFFYVLLTGVSAYFIYWACTIASGFSAELAASGVILMASTFGIPVSSTHILIGAVLGVGLVNKSANWQLMRSIGLAWIITIPSAAILSAISFLLLRVLLT